MPLDQDPLSTAIKWLDAGHAAALATVTGTWGSAPRPTGSQLVIREDGVFQGSVSGGCIEGAVITEALEVIASGEARQLEFGVSNAMAWDAGLACGGQIKIYLAPVTAKRSDLQKIRDLQSGGRAFVHAVNLESGADAVFLRGAKTSHTLSSIDLTAAVEAALRSDRSGLAGGHIFLHVHNPPLRLFLVGAVHIAQALIPIAEAAGYQVTVIDPRGAFSDDIRFPGTAVSTDWPDDALEAAPPDARAAVVTLTHDPKLDDAALKIALKSDAFYIGSLGSRKTHAARRKRLAALGFDENSLDRIHGPVGLAIAAKTPAEIAISIMAEIIRTLRGT